jgi:hypothetical protein
MTEPVGPVGRDVQLPTRTFREPIEQFTRITHNTELILLNKYLIKCRINTDTLQLNKDYIGQYIGGPNNKNPNLQQNYAFVLLYERDATPGVWTTFTDTVTGLQKVSKDEANLYITNLANTYSSRTKEITDLQTIFREFERTNTYSNVVYINQDQQPLVSSNVKSDIIMMTGRDIEFYDLGDFGQQITANLPPEQINEWIRTVDDVLAKKGMPDTVGQTVFSFLNKPPTIGGKKTRRKRGKSRRYKRRGNKRKSSRRRVPKSAYI